MTELLVNAISQDVFEKIPSEISAKVEEAFQSKVLAVEALQYEVERVKADYEQKCYEFDKKIIDMSSRLDGEAATASKATQRCKDLEIELKESQEKSSVIEMSFAECQGEIAALKHTHDLWKTEKLSMQHLLEERDLEINRLKDEWKTVSDKLTNTIVLKNKAELELDELQNSGITAQYHNKRLEREKELLSEHNKQLTNELSTKANELNSVKLAKENELVSLRGRLEIKMDGCKQAVESAENLRSSNALYQTKINELLEKLDRAAEEHRSMEELYRNEMQLQTKLADLYKASAKDEEQKSEELASAVTELQKLVNETAEANNNIQIEVKASQEKITELLKSEELLKKELEQANDLLAANKSRAGILSDEELVQLSPTAAMASKFMKSGMTLTEIYSKYVEAIDEMEIVKLENKRLNDTMDSILKELNEKAPIMKKQREEYERALATISQLTSQMDAAAMELQQSCANADDIERKLGRVTRENKRLQSESSDLAMQVKYLLKELEESRGRQVIMSPQRSQMVMEEEDTNVSSSSEVISKYLVTFKDISELQEQNQKLRQVIRELSDEQERKDSQSHDEKVRDLQETLERANEELERLREDRTRQIENVETIVRQRDMYRVLLAQEPNSSISPTVLASPSLLASPARGDSKSSARKDASEASTQALQVLKQEFDNYKKETFENNKLMNEQTEKLRNQISEINASNAKLQAQVEFSAERYDVLKKAYEDTKQESNILQEKNSKLLLLIQKHEMSLNSCSTEISRLEQEKSQLQAQLHTTRGELDIVRNNETRLESENTSLQRDHRGQSVLLTNLQKIQQTMEKQEFEIRSELRSQLHSQERELKSLKESSHDAIQQKQASLQTAEKHLLNSQQALEKEKQRLEAVTTELKSVEKELEMANSEKEKVENKLVSLEQRLSRLSSQKGGMAVQMNTDADTTEDVKISKEKCKLLSDEVNLLKGKLEKAQRVIDQHKDVAAAAEESLKQANLANEELSKTLEARLRNSSEHQIKLEQRITVLEDENRQLNSNKTSLISEVAVQTAELNRQVKSLQNDLDLAVKSEKTARKNEQDARKGLVEQTSIAHEAQSKYQREMLLHSETVKELVALKEKFEKIDAELKNAQKSANESQLYLDSNKSLWEKQKNQLVQENEHLKQRDGELNNQISLLHAQIETLSKQLISCQHKAVSSSPSSRYRPMVRMSPQQVSDTAEDKDKSNEQLMDIIKFLRKEKNLVEMKFEVAESEGNRLKQQLMHLQKQLEDARKLFQEEQKKSQASSSEITQHEAMMKKLQTLNVLSDSNTMLRDEKERLQEELQSAKSQITKLEQQISPVETQNRDYATQLAALKSEKAMLEQDVQRWQQRSQQLIQSPRRQDPEEYRKLIAERQQLTKNIDQLNKELTEKKLEISNLQGEIRNLNQQSESLKTDNAALSKKAETGETDVKAKQMELDEKNKTIMQIRRVGRRYKTQYEEAQKKLQELQANQKPDEEAKEGGPDLETTAKISAIESSLMRTNKEKEELQNQLQAKNTEVESLKKQIEELNAKIADDSKVSSSQYIDENQNLCAERDELKKQLQEKEEKSKKLLTLAKNRIEQIRRDKEDAVTERDRLRAEEQKTSEELERLKQNIKSETEQKNDLHNKIEELQRQLSAANSQQQQQSKITSLVGHHLSGPSGTMELRKAANIRPIPTQRVSQVSPIRVTRTARVMPEPQQEAQEGVASESLPARVSSPNTQVASSSTHTSASINISTSSALPTRAFVHPINPASRQQHVVSSMPTSSVSSHQNPSRSDSHSMEQANVQGSGVADTRPMESSSVAVASSSAEQLENDQAIVSSSDDQPTTHDESSQSSNEVSQDASATVVESEAAPSQSSSATHSRFPSSDATSSSSSVSGIASSGTATGSGTIISRPMQSQKRSHDDIEGGSPTSEIPASSSDSQVTVAPIPKRQRSSPDQSSEAMSIVTAVEQRAIAQQAQSSGSNIKQAESSEVEAVGQNSNVLEDEIDIQEGIQQDRDLSDERSNDNVGTSTNIPTEEVSGDPVPSSSNAEDVIVLSSDSDEEERDQVNIDEISNDQDMYNEDEEIDSRTAVETAVNIVGRQEDITESGEVELQRIANQEELPSSRPVLVLQPTPDFPPRTRPICPAPLTPGLIPSAADDGDGIVPYTPTLPTRRHDDNYQTINSPHVPPGSGGPIRFRFEDVSVPASSFSSQGVGIGSVDTTLMDFGGASEDPPRNVSTTMIHTIESAQPSSSAEVPVSAVSSSIAEQEDEPDKTELDDEMCVPMMSDSGNVTTVQSESRETTSNLQNIRGRRIRLIGARSRGRGGSSPSTSSQQP